MTPNASAIESQARPPERLAPLYALCADREQETREIHPPNDFYGNALALKSFLGLPGDYAVKAAMEHSAELGHGVWMHNLEAPLPAVLTMSPYRHAFIRERTDKPLYAVGPYVHYAPHALDEAGLAREKRRLGRNLLAFPAHSTHHVTCEHDAGRFGAVLRELGREFDRVRVCVYWKDVLDGVALEYARQGFECVSCGHIYDPMFLPRLKSLLAVASMTAANALTTALGYSVFMGVPHCYVPSMLGYSCRDEAMFASEVGASHYREPSPDIAELEAAFRECSDAVTPRQHEAADRYWGFSSIRDRDGLSALFRELEDMHARGERS